jgi:hypothetical protein
VLEWIGRLLSDPQGVPDEARFSFVLAIFGYLVFWAVWLHEGHPWQPEEYGVGMAALVTAYGVSVRARGNN